MWEELSREGWHACVPNSGYLSVYMIHTEEGKMRLDRLRLDSEEPPWGQWRDSPWSSQEWSPCLCVLVLCIPSASKPCHLPVFPMCPQSILNTEPGTQQVQNECYLDLNLHFYQFHCKWIMSKACFCGHVSVHRLHITEMKKSLVTELLIEIWVVVTSLNKLSLESNLGLFQDALTLSGHLG